MAQGSGQIRTGRPTVDRSCPRINCHSPPVVLCIASAILLIELGARVVDLADQPLQHSSGSPQLKRRVQRRELRCGDPPYRIASSPRRCPVCWPSSAHDIRTPCASLSRCPESPAHTECCRGAPSGNRGQRWSTRPRGFATSPFLLSTRNRTRTNDPASESIHSVRVGLRDVHDPRRVLRADRKAHQPSLGTFSP
jgi:hypothetical protein